MKIFIIAGENSGDNIGSLIIKSLKKNEKNIILKGIGGPRLTECGLSSFIPMQYLNLMGFVEIIPHIYKLRKHINNTVDAILEFDPDVVITIDSPGFCLRVASKLRGKLKGKIVHVVAPSVWAYKPERAKIFANNYDLLLAMLPFEPPYFEKEGLKTIFTGHFSLEEKICQDSKMFRNKYLIADDEKIICLTPGSRAGELKRHLPYFINTVEKLSGKYKVRAVFLAPNELIKDIIYKATKHLNNVIVTVEDKFELYKAANLAIAKSGTNSFEISLHGTPQIVTYKLNCLTWFYLKSKILIKFATLINIVAGKEIIPEFLQDKANSESIFIAADKLLSNDVESSRQIMESKEVLCSLKNKDNLPSEVSAKAILELLSDR
jgi:lipid-A-disaccharide synthase